MPERRYFSIDSYGEIVDRALSLNYDVIPFRDFAGVADKPILLLRHDLDHSFQFVQDMAELEHALGVGSTYFIQTRCEFYNLLSNKGRALVARLVELGHEIGLHYESANYVGTDAEERLLADLRLLEDLAGQKVVSAAQHLPSDQNPISVLGHVRNDAYETRFIAPPMEYVSDSLMAWRQATPHDLLDCRVSFQFLTHPENWGAEFSNINETLTHVMDAEVGATRQRFFDLKKYYAQLLEDRSTKDEQFRRERFL